MVRGKIIVTCPYCGKTFVAPDIEWHATALSAPIPCPHCGHVVDPNGNKELWGMIKRWMKKIGYAVW